jgi:hypothetical protein
LNCLAIPAHEYIAGWVMLLTRALVALWAFKNDFDVVLLMKFAPPHNCFPLILFDGQKMDGWMDGWADSSFSNSFSHFPRRPRKWKEHLVFVLMAELSLLLEQL